MTEANGWDGVAENYGLFVNRFTPLHAADLISALTKHIRTAKTILDIACGSGAVGLAYLSLFPNGIAGQTVICTDFSPKMVEQARKRISSQKKEGCLTEFKFQVEDAKNMSGIADASVDVVLSVFGVFLISPKEEVLAEVKRVLKPGAAFGMTAWTDFPDSIGEAMVTSGFGHHFQETVSEVFKSLIPRDPTTDRPTVNIAASWKAWSDPSTSKSILLAESFQNIVIHRTIHSTTFENLPRLWEMVTTVCPFVDLASIEEKKVLQVRSVLKDRLGVSEDEMIFMSMVSNVITCTL